MELTALMGGQAHALVVNAQSERVNNYVCCMPFATRRNPRASSEKLP
jgi:hypothetical protein